MRGRRQKPKGNGYSFRAQLTISPPSPSPHLSPRRTQSVAQTKSGIAPFERSESIQLQTESVPPVACLLVLPLFAPFSNWIVPPPLKQQFPQTPLPSPTAPSIVCWLIFRGQFPRLQPLIDDCVTGAGNAQFGRVSQEIRSPRNPSGRAEGTARKREMAIPGPSFRTHLPAKNSSGGPRSFSCANCGGQSITTTGTNSQLAITPITRPQSPLAVRVCPTPAQMVNNNKCRCSRAIPFSRVLENEWMNGRVEWPIAINPRMPPIPQIGVFSPLLDYSGCNESPKGHGRSAIFGRRSGAGRKLGNHNVREIGGKGRKQPTRECQFKHFAAQQLRSIRPFALIPRLLFSLPRT